MNKIAMKSGPIETVWCEGADAAIQENFAESISALKEVIREAENVRTITLSPSNNNRPTVTYGEWINMQDFKGITLNIPAVK